jgi:hypothetical protein
MISLTAIVLSLLFVLGVGALAFTWCLCAMSSRQEREAERQQWLAWCARQDDPERER